MVSMESFVVTIFFLMGEERERELHDSGWVLELAVTSIFLARKIDVMENNRLFHNESSDEPRIASESVITWL